MLPTFEIEENAKLYLDVDENKDIYFFHSSQLVPRILSMDSRLPGLGSYQLCYAKF